jgi:2-iminobutanoate/2-iminopropanoate deaminase
MSAPVGPYAPAVAAGQWLVCSGQIGIEPGPYGPKLVEGGFEAQAARALANVADVLKGRRLAWTSVVKTTVYLLDMRDYEVFNELYLGVLGRHRPARSLVAVAALPMGALVEIEVWAFTG